MNNILVYDTETNGKPVKWNAPMTQVNNWPRITELAWQIYTPAGELLNEHTALTKPDGWTIPKEQFFIDQGMSTERSMEEGVPIAELLDLFLNDMNISAIIVAHNINFDKNVLGAELIRAKLKPVHNNFNWMCTMLASTAYCRLPGQYGKYKWPSLTELHTKLFNEPFDGAHTALSDVIPCAKSFFKLVELGVIKIN